MLYGGSMYDRDSTLSENKIRLRGGGGGGKGGEGGVLRNCA
jgi:hypothetical protein